MTILFLAFSLSKALSDVEEYQCAPVHSHRAWDETDIEKQRKWFIADQEDGGTSGFETVSDPVEAQAATPPAIMPDDGDAPSDRLRPKWLVLAIVATVAAVVVVGLVG